MSALLLALVWKSALCAGFALLLLRLLKRRSAAERAFVANLALLALLLLPLAILLLPAIHLPTPAPLAEFVASVADEAPAAAAAPVAERPFDWQQLLLFVWLIPAAALLAALAVALIRLGRIRGRSEVIVDPLWLTALARAQRRVGSTRGTALLASAEVDSPLSWGILRPVILLDAAAAADQAHAEAIVAHELAHVVRADWLKLIAGRAATALFWFNPLVWKLARQGHQLCEEAADDAVLGSDIAPPDYAAFLVGAVRHANRGALLAAHGVAPGRSSLAQRVAHVLDPAHRRGPARLGWAAASLAGALAFNGALAAAEPAAKVVQAQVAPQSPLAEPLIEASERGDLTAMAKLIEAGASPNAIRDGDGTPLIAAAQAGRADAVSFLLARGADVNLGVRGDGNPLIAAAGAGQADIVRLLLDRGADIEAAVPEDENALITASRRGRAEVVRLLVARGADVNRAHNGRTPLAMAKAGGHAAIVDLLTKAGAMR